MGYNYFGWLCVFALSGPHLPEPYLVSTIEPHLPDPQGLIGPFFLYISALSISRRLILQNGRDHCQETDQALQVWTLPLIIGL